MQARSFLLHSGSTSVGDDDLYVHLFRGGRITVAGASGRVWAQGVLRDAAKPGPHASVVRYTIDRGGGPGITTLDVPFPSAGIAQRELDAAREAIGQAASGGGGVLGEGQHGDPTLPASPALPSARPPLASMLAAPLKHITLPPASPEIALHLLRALEALQRDGAEDEAAGFPAGYIEVDLPDDTWVLYGEHREGERKGELKGEIKGELKGEPGTAPSAQPPLGAWKARERSDAGRWDPERSEGVFAVPGPLPMLVWRRARAPSPQDRMALMERLRAAAAPVMRAWADPVLCPAVPAAGAAVF